MARILQFERFAIDPDARVLADDGGPLSVPEHVFDILSVLARARGTIVTKEQLVQDVWHGAAIGDSNISQHVLLARRAIGDTRKPYSVIQTVHGRGYRLVPDVRVRIECERDASQRAFRRTIALHYVRAARHFSKLGTHPAVSSSNELCRAALAIDHRCEPAFSQLALNAVIEAACGYREGGDALRSCKRHAARALGINASSAIGRLAFGYAALFDDRAPDIAFGTASRLLSADGISSDSHVLLMLALVAGGNTKAASRAAAKALQAHPSSTLVATYAAWVHYHTGRPVPALELLRRVLEFNPHAAFARVLFGRALLATRNYTDAQKVFETLISAQGPFEPRLLKFRADAIAGLAYAAAAQGDRDTAALLREELARFYPGNSYAAALTAVALGDQAQLDFHYPGALFAGLDPLLAR